MDWKNAYCVGIHEIDVQHKTVTGCISRIEQAVASRERWSDVNAALVSLSTHVHNHFILEESLMRIHDFPQLQEHANVHWEFLAQLRTLQEQSLTNNVLTDGVKFLQEWWDAHIQTHDKSYALHFLKHMALVETLTLAASATLQNAGRCTVSALQE